MKAKLQFEERFYNWCLRDWEREINQDYPFLSSVSYPSSRYAIRIMRSFPDKRRTLLASGLVKRFRQKDLLEQLGEEYTEEEKRLVQLYLDVCQRSDWIETGNRSLEEEGKKRIKRKELKNCIVNSLSSVFLEGYEDCGGWEVWRYCTKFGPWQLLTYFDVGGTSEELSYDHSIIVSERVLLFEGISLLSWLGLSGSTSWKVTENSQIEHAAKTATVFCSHFMNAVPKLLEGLSPD